MLGIPVSGKNILLLQGPVGPFFSLLAHDLRHLGARLIKINFNGGDAWFDRGPWTSHHYTGHHADWDKFIQRYLQRQNIQLVMLFGDERCYHRQAHRAASKLGIPVYVFEEGYLRPNYITLEHDGVNGNSSLPHDPDFYHHNIQPSQIAPRPVEHVFPRMAWYAINYYLAMRLARKRYPGYRHHRSAHLGREIRAWTRSYWRKLHTHLRDAPLLPRCCGELKKSYFLVPLQVHNDFQIKHSPYPNIKAFIEEVLCSFASQASAEHHLVIKHHPMDRGHCHYQPLIDNLSHEYDIQDRVHYVQDLHLPSLLQHALGTVVINSTVGLSSLLHNTPVITMGQAIYDIRGLSHQGSLAEFWQAPGTVDQALYAAFRHWLIRHNQANGSFYTRLPNTGNHTGIQWFNQDHTRPPLPGKRLTPHLKTHKTA